MADITVRSRSTGSESYRFFQPVEIETVAGNAMRRAHPGGRYQRAGRSAAFCQFQHGWLCRAGRRCRQLPARDRRCILKIIADIPAGASPTISSAAGPGRADHDRRAAPRWRRRGCPGGRYRFGPGTWQQTSRYPAAEPGDAFSAPPRPGDYIRPRGQDVRQGQVLLTKGRKLQPQDVGMLACHWAGAGAGLPPAAGGAVLLRR